MPNWGDVLREIQQEENKGLQQQQRGADHQKQAFDRVRWKYLSNFSELTGRNVITYYSGWLQEAMFKDDEGKEATIDNIVENLSDPNETKTHARHIHIENAKEYGLKIKEFESDDEIQDIVLTIHHAYMHTFASSNTYKIIENQDGKASVISMRSK